MSWFTPLLGTIGGAIGKAATAFGKGALAGGTSGLLGTSISKTVLTASPYMWNRVWTGIGASLGQMAGQRIAGTAIGQLTRPILQSPPIQSQSDSSTYQQVSKLADRSLPVLSELTKMIDDYIKLMERR